MDNINSAIFYEENVLILWCDCGMVTLWDLDDKKCIKNYKVSNYSCLYSDFLNRDHFFFVKTKEGFIKIMGYNTWYKYYQMECK